MTTEDEQPRLVVGAVVLLRRGAGRCGRALVLQDTPTRSRRRCRGVVRYDVQNGARPHRRRVRYPQTPPVGGAHNDDWQSCGFYSEPVRNELAVHSLEHGAVWITYREPLADADRQALTEIAGSNDFVLVSPYPGPARAARGVRLAAPAEA